MLIAHLADTHLGYRQYGMLEREEDIYSLFTQSVDAAIKEGVKAFLISGDMFDRPRPSNKALRIAIDNIQRLIDAGIKVYVVLGDHDLPKRFDLPPQELVPGLRILGTRNNPSHDIITLDGQEYLIAGLSHRPHREKYLRNLVNELGRLKSYLRKYRKSVLMLHQSIEELFRLERGFSFADIPTESYYVAMGHLHKRVVSRKEIDGGLYTVAYPGSIDIMRSDEINEWIRNGKGFYIVDLSGSEPIIHKVDLDVRPQIIVKTEYSNYKEDVRLGLQKLMQFQNQRKGIIHVTIDIPMNVKGDLMQDVQNIIGNRATVRLRINRQAPEIKSLKGGRDEINEALIIAEFIGDPKRTDIQTVAEYVLKLKKILSGEEDGSPEEIIDEIIKYRSIWSKLIKLPSLPIAGPAETSAKEGEGLLKFIR